jgi:hypothetical protein
LLPHNYKWVGRRFLAEDEAVGREPGDNRVDCNPRIFNGQQTSFRSSWPTNGRLLKWIKGSRRPFLGKAEGRFFRCSMAMPMNSSICAKSRVEAEPA